MNEQLSNKIKVLSFISILLVVVIHANHTNLTQATPTNFNTSFYIQLFFSHGIATVAVPLFFCISGYLFFIRFDGTLNAYFTQLKKRFYTLLVPYLFWCVLGILLISILQQISFTSSWINQKSLTELSAIQLLDLVFSNPIPYQFWFVGHLMALVLITPILNIGLRYLNILFIAAIFITCMVQSGQSHTVTKSLFFFATGAYLATNKVAFSTKIITQNIQLLFIIWIALIAFKTGLICAQSFNVSILISLQNLATLLGLVIIWFGYDKIMYAKNVSNHRLFTYTQYTFFIFAFHEPALTVIKKALLKIIPHNNINLTLVYFSTSLLTILLSISVAMLVKNTTPTVYGFVTGKR